MANLLSVTQIIDRESLAEESGWSELPGGLLMQWGSEAPPGFLTVSNDRYKPIQFPREFGEVPYSLVVTTGYLDPDPLFPAGKDWTYSYSNLTTTGANLHLLSVSAATVNINVNIEPYVSRLRMSWIAIGKA
jgi:hypothetical protein